MSHTLQVVGMLMFLSAIAIIFGVRKAKVVDPMERQDEEEYEFDEKVHYMKDHEYVWRKTKEISR